MPTEFHWTGTGETWTLWHNGCAVEGYTFRNMKVVEDDPVLIEQGRVIENAERYRLLNSLPFMPPNAWGRTAKINKYKATLNEEP